MEKTMQKYLVLVKTASGKGGEFWSGFSKMPDEPMKGVWIEFLWGLFGYWDFALFIKTDSDENACTLLARNCVQLMEWLKLPRHP